MTSVSIVVPIYKVEEYLSNCLESIMGQKFRDIEIILVDDGSTDASGIMCDEFAASQDTYGIPVYVIHQMNGGLSAARNSGIDWALACSDSEWICFVDSDDTISDLYVERLLDSAESNDADLVVCDFLNVDSDGNDINKPDSFPPLGLISEKVTLFETMHREWRVHPAWNKLYKKRLFQSLRFDVGKIHEDEYIIHKVFYLSGRVFFFPEKLYFYLIRSSGIIHTQNRQTKVDAYQAVIDRYWFCKERYLPIDLKVLGIEYMEHIRAFDDKNITRKYKEIYFDYKPNRTVKKYLSFLFYPIYNWYRKRRLNR